MNKLLKVGSTVVLFTSKGILRKKDVDKEVYTKLVDNIHDEDYILRFFNPDFDKVMEECDKIQDIFSKIEGIPFLSTKDNCVYWLEASPYSLPVDFVESVVDAFSRGNERAITAYKNFWTLLSLNPQEECRKNLWWFLQKHGLVVSSSGFFIAYRNADSTNEVDDEGNPVFTDHHSGTTRISIGHTVSIKPEECDNDSNVECSNGLHCASLQWLKQNYFGDTGLVVIVNPALVQAVPKNSSYGKLRTCSYTPIDYAEFDDDGHLIPYNVEQGFDCAYSAQAIYEGLFDPEQESYKIIMPQLKNTTIGLGINDKLLSIAKQCITDRKYEVCH